jgi:hypothetical protein
MTLGNCRSRVKRGETWRFPVPAKKAALADPSHDGSVADSTTESDERWIARRQNGCNMTITIADALIILATLVGPIVAVQTQKWLAVALAVFSAVLFVIGLSVVKHGVTSFPS